MAPPVAKENLAMDALMAALGGIGTPPSSWLTAPAVHEGVPPDKVPASDGPLVYAHHVRTEALPEEMGANVHRHRAYFHVYCFTPDTQGQGPRALLNLKADVLRAVFGAEGTITTAVGQPMYPTSFGYRDEFAAAGMAAGVQELVLDLDLTHTQP